MTDRALLATLAVVVLCLACTTGQASPPPTPGKIVLLTHDSFAISDDVLAKFTADHGVEVEVLKGGDAGAVVNQAILTKDNPVADVLYGVDNTFLSRAFDAGIFIPHHAPGLQTVPTALRLDPQERVTPIDYGDVCLNYDKTAYTSTAPPASLDDLVKPQFNGQLVVENPATSSPGLAFLLATIVRFGDAGDRTWRDYWADLRSNGVEVVNDWDTAYYASFSGGAGEGDRPIVVSYATSPAAEVVFSDPPVADASTAVVIDGCFRQVEFAGVLAGTSAQPAASAFVDFMLSPEFQDDIPLNMFVFPASENAAIPEVFAENAGHVEAPLQMDPAEIAANRERWVQEWTDVVLH